MLTVIDANSIRVRWDDVPLVDEYKVQWSTTANSFDDDNAITVALPTAVEQADLSFVTPNGITWFDSKYVMLGGTNIWTPF